MQTNLCAFLTLRRSVPLHVCICPSCVLCTEQIGYGGETLPLFLSVDSANVGDIMEVGKYAVEISAAAILRIVTHLSGCRGCMLETCRIDPG